MLLRQPQQVGSARITRPSSVRLRFECLEDRTLLHIGGLDVMAAFDPATIMVQVSDLSLVEQLVAQGARQVTDYGSFQTWEVAAAQAEALASLAGIEAHPEYNFVMLNAGFVNTTGANDLSEIDFSGDIFQLVQFAGPILPAWYEGLLNSGVEIVTPIPSNAYLVYGDGDSLEQLEAWAEDATYVQWVGAYHDEYKIDPRLTPSVEAQAEVANVPVMVAIQLFEDAAANAGTVKLINNWKVGEILQDDLVLGYRNIVVEVPFHAIRNVLAEQPDVVSIQPYVIPELLDEAQNLIIVNQLTGNVPTPGADYLTYLATKGFTQAQFDASGFSVAVVDDGTDNGTVTPNHFGLYRNGDFAQGDRLDFNRPEGTSTTSHGGGGHGNLNAHIVGGYVPSGTVGGTNFDAFPHSDVNSFKYGLGVAPFVRLGSAKIFNPGYTNPNFEDMESRNYNSGARISTNSWGANVGGAYTVDSQRYDALVRDAQPAASTFPAAGNQEMVIVFSAGNSGPGVNTTGAPGTAKNVITVGAAENVRAFGGSDGSGVGDSGADNANDIINFSSRGPTDDGRIKPEIVAPGTHVTGGVWQANPVFTPTGASAPLYTGSSVSGGVAPSKYFPTAGQQYYTASSGTSHSAPAVAGGAALIRQRFINAGLTPPSPALTKAELMASARYMTGVAANDTLWSNNQGMGGMNLDTFFDSFTTPTIRKDQSAPNTFTASGQTRTFFGGIANPAKPLRITVAWTDVPGPTSGNTFINNLDLEVTVGANTYKGNVFTGANSVTGGVADFRNNAESVFLPAGVTGTVTITVRAVNILGDGVPNFGGALDQDFALLAYNVREGLVVTSTVPAVGSVIATQPTSFTVNVTDPLNPATVQAGDFLVNSIAATSFAYTPGTTTVMFGFSSTPVTAQGLQTMHIDAAAFLRASDSDPLLVFDGTFRFDLLPLQVTTTLPAVGGTFAFPGPFTYDVNFNEAVDPASVQTTDLVLSGIAGASVTGLMMQPGNTTARFTLAAAVEGTLMANIAAGAVTDVFGNSGLAFAATYQVDVVTAAYPTPLAPLNPPGSLIYDRTGSAFLINIAGDADPFTLAVDPGQTITVLVTPISGGLRPSIQLLNPLDVSLGTATAAAAGQNALLQTVAATSTAAGAYKLVVSGAASTVGNYIVQVTLNAALESEGRLVGINNGTLAMAQDIGPSFLALSTSLAPAVRGGSTGRTGAILYTAAPVASTFTDISTTGTISTATGDDSSQTLTGAPLAGFAFPFFGTTQTSIAFSTNGLITFPAGDNSFTNSNLSTSPAQAAIAVLWDDLWNDNTGSNRIYWQVVGAGASQQLIIQWNNTHQRLLTTLFTFQAILSANGNIQLNYGSGVTTTNVVNSATVGVKTAGTANPERLLLSFNQSQGTLVGPNLSTLIVPPDPTPDYYQFSLNAGDLVTLAVTGLAAGILNLELREGGDGTLATGVAAANLTSVINNFLVPATATYYAHVSGDGNVPYSLVVTKNSAFDTESNDTPAAAQALGAGGTALGSVSAANPDVYSFSIDGPGSLLVFTTTPGGGLNEFVNLLDPAIDLLNPSDVQIATNDNGAADGRNAQLTVPVSAGTYKIRVRAAAGTGEYVVRALFFIDNGDTGFSTVNDWTPFSGQGFQNDVHYSDAGSGADIATWSFTVPTGLYRVAATWTPHANRATDAPFTVLNDAMSLGTVRVNQELAPSDFSDAGASWKHLGDYSITSTLVVQLSDDANEFVIADAIRFEALDPLLPTFAINDVSLQEGNFGTTNFVFSVTLSAASSLAVTVNYSTADGSATAGMDYIATSGTLSFPAGTTTALLTVQVNGDTSVEPSETFFVNLSNAVNAAIADVQGLGTIANGVGPAVIIDNGDAGFSTVGTWPAVSGQGFQNDVHYTALA